MLYSRKLLENLAQKSDMMSFKGSLEQKKEKKKRSIRRQVRKQEGQLGGFVKV